MKQIQREYKDAKAVQKDAAASGQNEVKQSGAAGRPQSWRQYIEQTEAAEKQAEREAAKVRAAKTRAAKKRFQPKAQLERIKTAWACAKADWAQEEPLRERAGASWAKAVKTAGAAWAKAVETAGAAAGTGWKKASTLTAGGWDKTGRAMSRVRSVVARHPVSPLLYLTLLAVVIGVSAFHGTYARAYVLEVNGQRVGVVSGKDEVDAIVNNIESRASDILGEHYDYAADISTTPVYAVPSELSDTAEIEDALFENVGALTTAYGLRVDGKELGLAPNSEDLYRMLDEVAQPYLNADTIRYEFVENVEVYPVEVPANTSYDLESIRATLNRLEVEQAVYTVQAGDTFNAIAYSLDMWPNELSVLNPDVIVDKLWIGQELVIQQAVPFLSVEMVADETYEELVHSPVEYIETADLYVGETRVKEQGEDGLALVNAHVTYVNGVEMEREIVQSTTLKEATTTYSYTGTTPRPVTASNGYYIWPVRGTITSNFGGRYLWGSYDFHLGIDIACPTGTAIKAADGGTVITAGWSGSYGYLVAIQHDNGNVTYYGHNSALLVSVGQKVYQGQIIAKAGMTGNATGPHCHFEVRINGTSVNPRNYLP